MADNILKIVAEFDVSQIIEGSEQATVAFDNLGNKVGDASEKTLDELYPAEKSVAEGAGTLQGAIAALTASIDKLSIAKQGAAKSAAGMTSAMGVARVEAGALDGSMGMMVGGLARVAAQSEILAPLIQAAFVPFAAFALLDILEQVGTALEKVSDDAVGYTKAVQDAEKETINWSKHTEESSHSLEEAHRKLSSTIKEQGDIAQQTFGQKWVQAMEQSTHATSAFGAGLADPLIGFTSLFTAEDSAANRTVQLGKNFDGAAKDIAAFTVAQDQATLSINAAKEAAERAGDSGNKVGQIQEEIAALAEEQRLKQAIATQERKPDEVKAIGEEYYYKRIELLNELSAAETEADTKARNEHDALAASASRVVESYNKLFEAEIEIQNKENEMFAKSQEKDAAEALKASEKSIEAWSKYYEETNKLAEQSSLRTITAEEEAVKHRAEMDTARRIGPNQTELQKGQITAQVAAQELADLEALENAKLAIIKKFVDEEKAILLNGQSEKDFAATASPEQLTQLEKINAEMEAAEQAHVEKMHQYKVQEVQSTQKAADEQMQAYMKGFQQINQGFQTLTDQILRGNLTIEQAFVRLGANLLLSIINSLEKMVLQFVEKKEILMTVIHTTTTETQVAQTASAAAQTKAIGATTALAEVSHSAAAAAAKAWDALAGIPVIGPVLGAIAAASTFAGVMAFGALAGAESGAEIDRDMPLFVHSGEIVAPKALSSEMKNLAPAISQFNNTMAASPAGGGAGSSSTMNSTNHLHISALDPQSFMHFAQRNQKALVDAARGFVRNGARVRA